MSVASDKRENYKIYGFGTKDGSGDVYSFHISNRNWAVSKIEGRGTPPSSRSRPVVAVWGAKLVVYGGYEMGTDKLLDDPTYAFRVLKKHLITQGLYL